MTMMRCELCRGTGNYGGGICPSCEGSGWLEMAGRGLVTPNLSSGSGMGAGSSAAAGAAGGSGSNAPGLGMKYIEYLWGWIKDKVSGGGSMYKAADITEDLDILKHYQGAMWEDVTDLPDTPANYVPPISDSTPTILLGEKLFKKGRVYAPKYPAQPILAERRIFLADITAGAAALETSTGYGRWKVLRYVLLTVWTSTARVAKSVYGAGGAPLITITRRLYNTSGTPGQILITSSVLFTISPLINATLLGFGDLLLQFDPPIPFPFYSEIRLDIAGNNAVPTFLDGYIGVEVI
jgi:hypothetical protein